MSEQEPRELPEPGPPSAPQGRVLAAVAAGGALGALVRHGAMVLWPAPGHGFPWTVFVANVTGCALIGVLMVLTVERGRITHMLVRPFLGVGVLGGYTTFSTYAMDVSGLLARQEAAVAMAYAAGTAVAALGSVWAAAVATRTWLDRGARPGPRGSRGTRGTRDTRSEGRTV